MIPRNIDNKGANPPSWWEELGHGAATISGFARLCADAIQFGTSSAENPENETQLTISAESVAILLLAKSRGILEIRAKKDGFDSAERLLAVAIEREQDRWQVLLDKNSIEQTVRFLDGFRELCRNGLILHHLQREFSLSAKGFDVAKSIEADDNLLTLLTFGYEAEV